MKTGRNDPCPCGSGQKYKRCCAIVPAAAADAAGASTAAEASATAAGGDAPLPRINTWTPVQRLPTVRRPSRMTRKKPS